MSEPCDVIRVNFCIFCSFVNVNDPTGKRHRRRDCVFPNDMGNSTYVYCVGRGIMREDCNQSKYNYRGIQPFRVTIIFELSFMIFWRPFCILLGYFYYDRLFGMLRVSFLAENLNWNSDFKFQRSEVITELLPF